MRQTPCARKNHLSRTRGFLPVLALMVVGILVFTYGQAMAKPDQGNAFKELYAPKEGSALAKAGCLVCHAEMKDLKKLNPYGADLKKQLEKTKDITAALKAIEPLDSDKDGVKNIDEIKAGTLPGDPTSKP
ncbi:MAG: hypothetical protein QN189_07175 [Armatimonadota bacterium]|nr:hypothetical protein [Armatimonadota bacterium]